MSLLANFVVACLITAAVTMMPIFIIAGDRVKDRKDVRGPEEGLRDRVYLADGSGVMLIYTKNK